jgi:uncharacterized membrane protein YdjX (TVP38/TMEM64 family)
MEELGQLVAGLEGFVRHYGAFAVMPILAIEAVGAPVPGESLLIFASVLAGRGEMSLSALLAFAWAGSVIGDNLGYLIGRKVGRGAVLRYGEQRSASLTSASARLKGRTSATVTPRCCSPGSSASYASSTASWRERWECHGGVSCCLMRLVQRSGSWFGCSSLPI